MPPVAHTSMHSLIRACTTRRDSLGPAASPNVQPRTALMPENAALISSLLQRVPMKFSSTSTVPIISSSSFTLSKCLLLFADIAPSEKERASGALVSSQTPGDCMVAPHATVQPSTLSSPRIDAICTSGRPFWNVTSTPSGARKSLSIVTTSLLFCCLVIRKMISYVPDIWSGV